MQTDPVAYLPHRSPFLFIDRLLEREPGVRASALTRVPTGRVPMPPILLVEAMAQLAGIAAAQEEGEGGFLASIDQAVLPAQVEPGATLLLEVRIVKSFGKLFICQGETCLDGMPVASATMTLGIGTI